MFNLQPAVHRLGRILSKRHHEMGKGYYIYNTWQMYLKEASKDLKKELEYCDENNIPYAVKLVRGAYLQSDKQHCWESKKLTGMHVQKKCSRSLIFKI